jgi:hypothetical protein
LGIFSSRIPSFPKSFPPLNGCKLGPGAQPPGPGPAIYRNFRRRIFPPHPPETPSNINKTSAPYPVVMRSYQGYYTRSHQNSEVKRLWAGIVLGWVTSREVPVLHPPFCSSSSFFLLFSALLYYPFCFHYIRTMPQPFFPPRLNPTFALNKYTILNRNCIHTSSVTPPATKFRQLPPSFFNPSPNTPNP